MIPQEAARRTDVPPIVAWDRVCGSTSVRAAPRYLKSALDGLKLLLEIRFEPDVLSRRQREHHAGSPCSGFRIEEAQGEDGVGGEIPADGDLVQGPSSKNKVRQSFSPRSTCFAIARIIPRWARSDL